ncbi:SMP-30/gluconolactonase/LRE family protein [Aeromicrobium sp.]|uniref:SMP-30/gluconolactonase/LRE family protein n=1 Tax=Aeromicrobium sp. TaxID=1871063 RepID=UPI0025BC6AE0|nr:SMP-30/gluconolactonase/LRE family protein [Aeromicrobium sp.]MCK5892597.1 SMP-30/gluconolactonase/LRE family protein [Aeromicrobium sp.]
MATTEAPRWDRWSASQDGVGENPVWDAAAERLWWSDVVGPSVRWSAEAGAVPTSVAMPSDVATFALADGGAAVVVLVDGIHELRADGTLRRLLDAPYDRAQHRFNDGRCDTRGRLWIGSNRIPGSGAPRGSARFWRLDAAGLTPHMDGFSVSNGTAFSPEGDVMYAADSMSRSIVAFDYDLDTGTPSNRRVFATVEGSEGGTALPDGAAVDARGGYWIAVYGAGLVLRFAPDGRLDRVLRAPVTHPTMVAFGGASGDRMFLTSGRAFASPEVLAAEPGAGDVYVADVGERGVPEHRFGFLDALRRASTL